MCKIPEVLLDILYPYVDVENFYQFYYLPAINKSVFPQAKLRLISDNN
jgi:hypothetical protein